MNPPGRQGLVVASGRGRPALPLAGQPSVPPSELQPLEFAYIFGNTVACWFYHGRDAVSLICTVRKMLVGFLRVMGETVAASIVRGTVGGFVSGEIAVRFIVKKIAVVFLYIGDR